MTLSVFAVLLQDRPFEGVINNIERRYRETSSEYFKNKMEEYIKALEEELCAFATAELANILNVSGKRITEMMPFVVSSISLNTRLDNGEFDSNTEVVDVFDKYYQDETSNLETALIAKETREELRRLIAEALSEKEIYILSSRWGLSNMPIKEVSELAAELGMSKQGVRQCEERAREKLKKHLLSLNKSLSDFI